MGIRSDALLVYGVDIGSEEDEGFPFEIPSNTVFSSCDTGDFLAVWAGIVPPDENCSEEEYEWYHNICVAMEAKYPNIEIVDHCHPDWSTYIVALRGKTIYAGRGSSTEIFPSKDLFIYEYERQDLVEFLQSKGIYKEPEWLLCSYSDF